MSVINRTPAVAGQFYTDNPKKLRIQIQSYIDNCDNNNIDWGTPVAGIVPHAGYLYSGLAAAHFYRLLKQFKGTAVILSPNHTGRGAGVSVAPFETWETPLGKIKINTSLRDVFIDKSGGIAQIDDMAHLQEHSIEVHLPFLQYLNPEIKIVPITIGLEGADIIKLIATILHKATLSYSDEEILVIASSDMSHFISSEKAKQLDFTAINPLLDLDWETMWENVTTQNISMCGRVPAAITTLWAKLRGAQKGHLLKYTNSGDITGDTNSVVAYATMAFYK